MRIQKSVTVRFSNDDLRRLRRVLGFHSPKGHSIPIGKLIKKIMNQEYENLKAIYPNDKTLDLID